MKHAFYAVPVKMTNCYLIRGDDGWVLVDSGIPGGFPTIRKHLEKWSIAPRDVRLVIITHGHIDHFGSAGDVRDATGADILIHLEDLPYLERGIHPFPKGVTIWGKALRALSRAIPLASALSPGGHADIIIGNEDYPLRLFGICGRVVHTPGHTRGSVSVLLDTGEAFVGDLAFNGAPFCLRPKTVLADDIEQVGKSWRALRERGVRHIYPGHGKPFPVERYSPFAHARGG
jgi:hydroxyacylglutathione hydrolase